MHDNAPRSTKIPRSALPRSEAARLDWLRLVRSHRVGPATFIRLIREHGGATEALERLPALASSSGVRDYTPFSRADAEAEWDAALKIGAVPLLLGADDYPGLLATAPDAPPFLWALGDTTLGHRPSVALVGARNASALGCRMAKRLAADLGAHGLVVSSGLARGIDAAAHQAALGTGTIAAQAGGIDILYPRENADLAHQIAEQGLRLSEMPIGHDPRPKDFPRRNRIISGLSIGVVVVEGAMRSGSLITARNALDQGREVMAVPGNPMDARAGGCNQLIRDGAILVRSAEDVIEAIAAALPHDMPEPVPAQQTHSTAPKPVHSTSPDQILALLGLTPMAENLLIRETGLSVAEVSAKLTDLELTGQIQRHPGGMISLPPG